LPGAGHAQETDRARILSFVETHCIDCHNDSESNGDFNIDALGLELTDEAVGSKNSDELKVPRFTRLN